MTANVWPGTYRPPLGLPGGHLQTIWPACVADRPAVAYRREDWPTPDGDVVTLDWLTTPVTDPARSPCVVLWHGLEGSSDSHYARALMHTVAQRGHHGVVMHFRGCAGPPNQQPRCYHSGDSAELTWMVPRIRAVRAQHGWHGPLWLVGVSLGGNVLLKWLGECGQNLPGVMAAAAISAPQDLHAAALRLNQGLSRLYQRHFLHSLRRKALALWDRYPGLFDRTRVAQASNFFDFDDSFTAPVHGYASAHDYWRRASCRPWLAHIRTPTLVLNACNDPFLPASALARTDQVSPCVTLDYPAHGGHVGFPGDSPHGPLGWLPQRLYAFFDALEGTRQHAAYSPMP